MRSNSLLIPLAAALLLVVTGCEKVITLDLQTSPAQVVIEANLVDDGYGRVSLSRSVNYTETNTFPPVVGAVVTLTDDAGGRETLRETSPGQYAGVTLKGVPGRTYTLRVETGGTAYVALSTLPVVVPFENLASEVNPFGADDGLRAVVQYTDPAGRANSYLFRQYRNGRLNKAIFLQNDKYTDGKPVSEPLRNQGGLAGTGGGPPPDPIDKLGSGDTLTVEMQNVDAGVYEYFRTLNQILDANPAFSVTPTNPKTTISGGALGYFSAHSSRTRRLILP